MDKHRIKILVVDDQEEIRYYMRDFFQKRGHQVFTADSDNSALAVIKDNIPEVLVLDRHINGSSGFNLLQHIREFNNNIKVIILSGSLLDPEDAAECRRLDVSEFLNKPVELNRLENAVSRLF